MSANTQQSSHEPNRLQTLPTFGLRYRFDDDDGPETVTVFDEADERITTHWMTVELDHAVALEDAA